MKERDERTRADSAGLRSADLDRDAQRPGDRPGEPGDALDIHPPARTLSGATPEATVDFAEGRLTLAVRRGNTTVLQPSALGVAAADQDAIQYGYPSLFNVDDSWLLVLESDLDATTAAPG